jgi:hypothetical protein
LKPLNPFTERGRISNPAKFTGRWREVSLIFDQLERRRPVLISGGPGIGRSSLLTHIAQSAGAVLEIPELIALSLDLALLDDAATVYRLIAREFGIAGSQLTAVQRGLERAPHTVLLVLDNAQDALAAGWGADLLEGLARLARRSLPRTSGIGSGLGESIDLLLVVTHRGAAPALSEPFTVVGLGALAPAEVRLLLEAYLEGTAVEFAPATIHELARVSVSHPAYLQRAAYHCFLAAHDPSYDWRAHYWAEVQTQPIPGAPLPPEAFVGDGRSNTDASSYGELGAATPERSAPFPPAAGIAALGYALGPLLLGLIALQVSGQWWVALFVLLICYGVVALIARRQPSER